MSKQERARMYKDFLAEEGYAPKFDDDGDVTFKAEGRTYFIVVSETDDEYFQLLFPNFWPIESEKERAQALLAASRATNNVKCAKVCQIKDNMVASIEAFYVPADGFKPTFKRSLMALRSAVDQFAEDMKS